MSYVMYTGLSHPAGQDYQAVTNMRLGPFGNSQRRQCFNVSILNDPQLENPEDFVVNVHFCPQPDPRGVDIDPSNVTTTILDAGELHEVLWTTTECNL